MERDDFAHDLALPTLLFAALGAMTWAVRGTAGASAMNAHIAPGLTWGAAWWFVAREPTGAQSRRYASGWVLFALTMGFALAGNRGWVQWSHFFEGHLSTDYVRGEWVPLSTRFGFLWLFIAGAAWAGLPACLLAWCGNGRPLRAGEWTLRIACGLGGAYLAWRLYVRFPEVFLPKYGSIASKYHDFHSNPGLARLYRDNGAALRHAGYCIGFLLFEAVRRDWKNVLLIATVGLLNGLGWAACQNWKWAAHVWPDSNFNFWRCWECCGGISIGIAFGVAYFLVNRKQQGEARVASQLRPKWLLAAGLLLLIGWIEFWPAARDLRQDPSAATPGTSWIWGAICLAAGIACVLAFVARRLLSRKAVDANARRFARLNSWESWTEVGLTLVLAWFIRREVLAGFGDGPRDTSQPGWLAPGNIYFYVIAAWCLVRLVRSARRYDLMLDRLATYLGLLLILIAAIGDHLTTWWKAPVWFALVGAAFGIVYTLLSCRNRVSEPATPDPNLERWGAFVGLLYGLGLSLRKTIKGAAEVYVGNDIYWDHLFWSWIAFVMLACMLAGLVWLLSRRLPATFSGNVFPRATGMIWLVLIAENVVAQVVTGPIVGPRATWGNSMFNVLYVILFALTAVIVYHFQCVKTRGTPVRIDTLGTHQ